MREWKNDSGKSRTRSGMHSPRKRRLTWKSRNANGHSKKPRSHVSMQRMSSSTHREGSKTKALLNTNEKINTRLKITSGWMIIRSRHSQTTTSYLMSSLPALRSWLYQTWKRVRGIGRLTLPQWIFKNLIFWEMRDRNQIMMSIKKTYLHQSQWQPVNSKTAKNHWLNLI